MQIFFDHQIFSQQTYGGISRYFSELITGINKTVDNQAYLSLLFSNNIHLHEKFLNVNSFLPTYSIPGKGRFIHKTNHLFSIAQLKYKTYDIFHATYYDPYFIPYTRKHPFVITFLDMIHEKFSDQYSSFANSSLLTKQKKLLADRADRIIAISESTKRDIVELLQIDPGKIDVIYLGNSLKLTSIDSNEGLFSEPYLLFVGRRERYKNFIGLVQSIHPLLKKYKLKLLCAGGDQFTDEENSLIHSVGLSNLVEQRPINNDHMLNNFYKHAFAFIFPTLYEGFGIPVLEAFACDCPCIVSNLSSLPEVAGQAALYINPALPESIPNAVEKLLHDEQYRQILIKKGREQLNHFSWERNVKETLNLYKTLT